MRFFVPPTLAAIALVAALPALAQQPATGSAPAKPPAAATAPASPAAATPNAALIDINSAAKDDLDKLPQIGAARAEAIVKGRPYKGKNELLDKKIIPPNAYEAIKDRIVARQKS